MPIEYIAHQDVYAWAGKLRSVRIHKEQTTFAYPEHIASEADRIFATLRRESSNR